MQLYTSFLPIHPIEEMFSKVKACLRENDMAIQSIDQTGVVSFVEAAFSTVNQRDIHGWYKNAGYVHM